MGRSGAKDGKAVALTDRLRQDRGQDGAESGRQEKERRRVAPPLCNGKKVGSMNRPAAAIGIVFEEDFDVGVVQFVGGQDAEFVVNLEENDRGHEGTGEVPGGLLGESEIV